MNRNSVLDFLGVVRAVALASISVGVAAVVLMVLLSLIGTRSIFGSSLLLGVFGFWLVAPGVIVACIASLSRVLVRRMRFYSQTGTS